MAKDDDEDGGFDEDKYNEQVNGDPEGCMDDEECGLDTDDEHDHLPED